MSVDGRRFAGPVLVTGANGFIGRHLCSQLAADGENVHAVVRASSSRAVAHSREVTIHTLRDPISDYSAAAYSVQPTVVFHLATLFQPRHRPNEIARMVEDNITFGTTVADSATRTGARLIHVTSAWQHYAGAEYSPVSLYAATKQALCDIIRYFTEAEGLISNEVCLFDTYGPRDDRKKLVWLLLDHAASGEPLPMSSGHHLIDLTHVDDVVAALVQVATGPTFETRLVVRSGNPMTIRALAALVERVTGHTIDTRWDQQPARPREMQENWDVPGASTSWRPKIDLTTGVARLWDERMGSHG